MPYFSGTIFCFLVTVDFFFDRANKHGVQSGKGNFEVDFNLVRIKGDKTTSSPFISFIF